MKHALLSYIQAPFRLPPDHKVEFSNPGIARGWVRALNELEFHVDVIECTDTRFQSEKKYDLLVGHGGVNWEYLRRTVAVDCPAIYFSTGTYWEEHNRAEAERFESLKQRRGVSLPLDRWITHSEEMANRDADGIIALGNADVAKSYSKFPLCIPVNNAVYADRRFESLEKDYERGRKRFVFFGGIGCVHKGLDRLIEAFSGLDCELYCTGQMESHFLDVYRNDLAAHPNIKLCGWVPLKSPAFYELMDLCDCVIFPSCAEGQPGSVLECMNQGLIPIISRACHIDVAPFGTILETCSVEEIRQSVQSILQEPASRLRDRSLQARAAVLERHTEEIFCTNLKNAIQRVLDEASRKKADHEKEAAGRQADLQSLIQHSGKPAVVVDGVIFQLQAHRPQGIWRVWENLLQHLARFLPDYELVVLQRKGFPVPTFPGVRVLEVPTYPYLTPEASLEKDEQTIGKICQKLGTVLFLSTYYSHAHGVHNLLMMHDMIPEVMGYDLQGAQWVAKRRAIEKASSFVSVSHSTHHDLSQFYQVGERPSHVIHSGVTPLFQPADAQAIEVWRQKHRVSSPYFLLVGNRGGYKNAAPFFEAYSRLSNAGQLQMVAVGGESYLLPAESPYINNYPMTFIEKLSDEDLRTAYSGALALVYPSRYEGFGLPIIEAMACGCPVLTSKLSSIPEVAGNAARYIDPDSPANIHAALIEVQQPSVREQLSRAGRARARLFRWERSAFEYASLIRRLIGSPLRGTPPLKVHLAEWNITPGTQSLCQYLRSRGIDVTTRGWGESNPSDGTFEAFLQKERFDVVHFQHHEKLPRSWMSIAAKNGARVCLALQDTSLSSHPETLRQVDFVATASPEIARQISTLSPDTSVEIVSEAEQWISHYHTLCGRGDKPMTSSASGATAPLLSAIVSVYNCESFIRGCLEDLVAQTLFKKGRMEIVLVNTGSPQNEDAIIREFTEKYSQIRYIKIPERETIYAAWNRGIQASTGKYLTNANADDRHRVDGLERMVEFMEALPQASVAYSFQAVTDEPNKGLDTARITGYYQWPNFDARLLFSICFIGPQPIWRRSLHDTYGYFDPKYRSAGDYEFWLRLAKHEKFLRIPEILGLYLHNPGGVEHQNHALSHNESEEARQKHWPSEWGARPAPGFQFLVRSEEIGLHPAERPLVSIIIPTYNRPTMLVQALKSLAAQTFKNFEVIVVNDAGEDVRPVLENFRNQFPIVYLTQSMHRERSVVRNIGIQASCGKYIGYLDDDDRFHPDHLETLVSYLESTGAQVAYTDANRALQEKRDGTYVTVRLDAHESSDFNKDRILVGNFIPILCVLHKKDCLQSVGAFDENLATHEDWDLWIRLSRKFEFHHIRKVTVEYSFRLDGSSTTSGNRADFLRTMQIIYNVYRPFTLNRPEILEAQQRSLHAMQAEVAALKEWERRNKGSSQSPFVTPVSYTAAPAPAGLLISIVIPTFNKWELTRDCLEAIRASTREGMYEIIVVDNASTDITPDELRRRDAAGELRAILNSQNMGFGHACNQGAKAARAPHIVFLNNDTTPKPKWVEYCLAHFKWNPKAGIVGNKLLYPNGTIQHGGIHFVPLENPPVPHWPQHRFRFEAGDFPPANECTQVHAITGACLFIPRDLFWKLGGFSDEYGMYFEDIDLNLKVMAQGLEIIYEPRSVVIHYERSSATEESANEKFVKAANIFLSKWEQKLPDLLTDCPDSSY